MICVLKMGLSYTNIITGPPASSGSPLLPCLNASLEKEKIKDFPEFNRRLYPIRTNDEIILAAVGFISYNNNIAPIGKQRIFCSNFIGEKLLNRTEDYPARSDRKQFLQSLVDIIEK
jgi:hypothetical protein